MLDELESSDTEDNDASLPDQDAADGEVGGSPAVLGTGAACAAAAGLTVPLQDGDAQVSERRSGSPHPFFNPKRPHREVNIPNALQDARS